MKEKSIGKSPPQATDLEEAVLGAVMLEKDAMSRVAEKLSPSSFYKDSNRCIFEACLNLYSEGKPIDLLTVTSELRKLGKLESAGGAFYVTELTSKVSSAANLEYHSTIILQMAMKRDVISFCTEAMKNAFEDQSDVFEIIDKLGSNISKASTFTSSNTEYMRTVMNKVYEKIRLASTTKDGLTGIDTGWACLNKVTGGWQDTDLIIIAARPSMGKSDFAINACINAALSGVKVAMFNLEMGNVQIGERVLAISREIDRGKIKSGKMDDSDWSSALMVSSKILNNLIIQDNPSITPNQFRGLAKYLKEKEGVQMIAVDYLQLMSSSSGKGNKNEAISEVSRSLKIVAKELHIPVIALSQLNREVESRTNKRPVLSDLRDSGAIEQDADIVMFPLRPEYYGITQREDGSTTFQLMELDIAKNRSGATGSIDLRYKGKFGKITDYSDVEVEVNMKPIPEYNPDRFHTSGVDSFEKAPF